MLIGQLSRLVLVQLLHGPGTATTRTGQRTAPHMSDAV